MRVAQDLADLREADNFLPWLRQVDRNVCRRWRRRQRATPEPLDAIAELDDSTAAARGHPSILVQSSSTRSQGTR
jgi:DNA-directed RNA polymerase specialized sigma24 family protein